MNKHNVNILNRKASHEYHFLLKFTAGIMLLGSEIKSVREGNVNMVDAFCFLKDDELFIKGLNIGTYKQAAHYNHEPLRVRKLLLTKTELRKLKSKSSEKGLTIIPIRVFISETGYAKIEIAIAQGKKSFDKREDLKKRDVERDIKRHLG